MPFITLDQACLAYGHVALLDHTGFQLDEGERVGLIGRNGGGKSSMMRVLAGQVTLDDGVVWRAPAARICYVSQEPQLNADDTVFDAVAQGLGELQQLLHDYHRVSQQMAAPGAEVEALLEEMQRLQTQLEAQNGWAVQSRIETAIARLDLDADKRVGELSGGQRKRVALAQMLIRDPKILLMDEPFGPLDAQTRQIMGNLLLDLWAADKKALIFVTHDLEEAIALSDRVVIMSSGPKARIIGDHRIDLPRPRNALDIRLDPRFHEIQQGIWAQLRAEVIKAYGDAA